MAQKVKHLPAMRETGVRPLGQEDPLEKEMATYLSTLAWKIPWMEEPGGLQSMGLQSWTRLSDFTFTFSLANISWNSQPQGRDVLNFFLPVVIHRWTRHLTKTLNILNKDILV